MSEPARLAVALHRLLELGRRLSEVGSDEVKGGRLLIRQLAEPVPQPQQDDVEALAFRRKEAVRVQQRLQDLAVRRQFHAGVDFEFVQPEAKARQQCVGGEACGHPNSERGDALTCVAGRRCEGRERRKFAQYLYVSGLPTLGEPVHDVRRHPVGGNRAGNAGRRVVPPSLQWRRPDDQRGQPGVLLDRRTHHGFSSLFQGDIAPEPGRRARDKRRGEIDDRTTALVERLDERLER